MYIFNGFSEVQELQASISIVIKASDIKIFIVFMVLQDTSYKLQVARYKLYVLSKEI